jgi:hypothetical protein
MRELFVYYRVAEADLGAAAHAVGAFQAALRGRHPALQAKLLRRPELTEGRATLMEVYAQAGADGVDADLQADIERHAQVLQPWLQGPRRVEVFHPCA